MHCRNIGLGREINMTVKKGKVVRKKNMAKFDKVDSLNKEAKKGRWVTVNGRHKFIEEK